MDDIIVMIHGMWGNSWVWDNYKTFFENKDYICITPTLRYHDMDPNDDPDPRLGSVSLLDYADDIEKLIRKLNTPPIIVGHSMGGIIAQILAKRGLAEALVLLTPASPSGIMSQTPSVIKSFWSAFAKWGFWKKPMRQTFKEAAYSTLGVLPEDQKKEAFSKFVYESGRAASEIGYWYLDSKKVTKVDETNITCPVLIVAGSDDKMTPTSVTRKIANKYKDVATYKEFENHGHWVVGEPGWEVIAEDTSVWLDKVLSTKRHETEPYVEQRNYKRIPYQVPVIYSGAESEAYYHGKAGNYSMTGIQFESEVPLQQGSDIDIKLLDSAPGFNGPQANDDYRAEVIWCKEKPDESQYDIGVRFSDTRDHLK